tara:strand:- start:1158 stop:1349 length:192 start_codon:yes stop_codon:yes gene_type:complete
MQLNQLSKYVNVIGKGIPVTVEMLNKTIYYGTEELDIAYGKYEKHTSLSKFIKNIKQILWRRS